MLSKLSVRNIPRTPQRGCKCKLLLGFCPRSTALLNGVLAAAALAALADDVDVGQLVRERKCSNSWWIIHHIT